VIAQGIGLNADILRALGWSLDQEDATSFSVLVDHEILKVAWETSTGEAGHRAYREYQLDSHTTALGPRSNAELLRTIGQDFDRDRITVRGITRDAEGFRASGLSGHTYVTRAYKTKDMLPSSIDRQVARGEKDPFAVVKVGVQVVTDDGVRMGTVRKIRGRFMQVGLHRFGGRFWLPSEVIADCNEKCVTELSANPRSHRLSSLRSRPWEGLRAVVSQGALPVASS
jgi:hypothetical protein